MIANVVMVDVEFLLATLLLLSSISGTNGQSESNYYLSQVMGTANSIAVGITLKKVLFHTQSHVQHTKDHCQEV